MFEAPIYTKFYKVTKDEKSNEALRVYNIYGDFFTYLVPATIEDGLNGVQIYVRCEHELKYPYAKYDYKIEYTAENDLSVKLGFEKQHTEYFAAATLVATPQMGLI